MDDLDHGFKVTNVELCNATFLLISWHIFKPGALKLTCCFSTSRAEVYTEMNDLDLSFKVTKFKLILY